MPVTVFPASIQVGVIDVNSSTTLLNAGQTFSGEFSDDSKHVALSVYVKTDQDGIIRILHSDDGVTVDDFRTVEVDYIASEVPEGVVYLIPASTAFTKIEFENTSGVNQTQFVLQTKRNTGAYQNPVLPLNAPLTEGSTVSSVRAVLAGKKDDGSSDFENVQVHSDSLGTSIITAPGHRLSQVFGRTHQEVSSEALTADSTLFTVPANKTFYVTSIQISGTNTSTGDSAIMRIKDGGSGGTMKMPFHITQSQAAGGGTDQTAVVSASFTEPLQFDTDVFFDLIQGTIEVDIVIIGYLEAS